MIRSTNRIIGFAIFASILGWSSIFADNGGRYWPFSYRPEKSFYRQKSTLDIDAAYISGHNIANDDAAPIGLGEVFGTYDLQNMLFAMDQIGLSTSNAREIIGEQFSTRPILFDVHGKFRSGGLFFHFTQPIVKGIPIALGINIPVVQAASYLRFSVNQRNIAQQYAFTQQEQPLQFGAILDEKTWLTYQERFDRARRNMHEQIGFLSNHWSYTGIGDVDLYARFNVVFDHRFLMRTVDILTQYGVLIPAGPERSNEFVASMPFSNDGHWAMYVQCAPSLELKEDLRVGFLLRGQYYLPKTRDRRLPVLKESFLYSPMIGRVRIQPGNTFICSGYLALENVYDGLHLQGRYTYKRHGVDQWDDMREDKTISSYLSRNSFVGVPAHIVGNLSDVKNIVSAKEYLSKYRSHYITIQLAYDPKEAQKNLYLDPKFFVSLETPIFDSSRGIMQANQITIGAELHF